RGRAAGRSCGSGAVPAGPPGASPPQDEPMTPPGAEPHLDRVIRRRRSGVISPMADPATSGWRSTVSWSAVLFIIGSACFAIGPFPGFLQLVGAAADAAAFFVGSLFFTSAAALQ